MFARILLSLSPSLTQRLRKGLRRSVYGIILLAASQPSAAASLQLQLDDWQDQRCLHNQAHGIWLQSQPLRLNITALSLDLNCLFMPQAPSSSQPFSSSQLKIWLENALNQIQSLPFAQQVLNAEVSQLTIYRDQQLLVSGNLQLQHQAKTWQLSFNNAHGLKLTVKLSDDGKHSHAALILAPQQYQQWQALWPSLPRPPEPLNGMVSLNWQGSLLPQLKLAGEISAGTQQLDWQIKHWHDWQLQLNAPAQHWHAHATPPWQLQLSQQHWSWQAPTWQLSAQGQWQHAPQWQVEGQLKAEDLASLQRTLLPPKAQLQILSGQAGSHFTWSPEQIKADYQLSNINLLWQDSPLSQLSLSGRLQGISLQQLHHQGRAHFASLDIGTELKQGDIAWHSRQAAPITQWQALNINHFQLAALGGQLSLAPFSLAFPSNTTLRLKQVQLEHIAQLYPELALFMQGSLDGELPVSLQPTGIAIHQGSLAINEQGGRIALSHQAVANLKQQNPMLDFSLSLLEDFHYQNLGATLDFSEEGDLDMQVHLAGHNRQVTPRMVEFNYHHQENIYQLMRSLRIGEQLSGQLQQWIDAASSAAAP